MDPLTTRARLLELEAEMQRIALGVTLAEAHAQTRPLRLAGSLAVAAAGWLLRRRAATFGGSWLLGRLWPKLR